MILLEPTKLLIPVNVSRVEFTIIPLSIDPVMTAPLGIGIDQQAISFR
jgi:hypothetical protein